MSELFESSSPLQFKLIGRFGGQNDGYPSVLYSRVPVQSLDLEIYNTSRGLMKILPSSIRFDPAKDPHFYLTFHPGTLWDQKIRLTDPAQFAANDGWVLEPDNKRLDRFLGYYLYRKTGTVQVPDLKPAGEPIKVQIGNIQIDGSGGSRSTGVELKYRNIITPGYDKALSGSRQQYLAIMDELPPQGNPPIAVEWVGASTNQVLNDGVTLNRLTLRLQNRSGHDLTLTAKTNITLSFPQATDKTPWGLLQEEPDRTSVSIEGVTDTMAAPAAWPPKVNLKGYDTGQGVAVASFGTGLTGSDTKTLRKNDEINIPITLKCSAPSGTARLQVHYEGFGGLVDDISVEVVKTALVVEGSKVGIGIRPPKALLHVFVPSNETLSTPGQDNANWAAIVENRINDYNSDQSRKNQNGLLVANRWGDDRTVSLMVGTYWDGGAANFSPGLVVTGGRKVGIGTTNPSKLLTIGDGTNNAAHALIRGGWGNADINKHGILYLNDTNWGIGAGSIKNNDNLYLFRFGQRPFRIMRGLPSDSDIDTKTDLFISTDGKVGIGTTSPQQMLSVQNGINIDQASQNNGTLPQDASNALKFGSNSGEGIASKRTAGDNQYGLDFYTSYANRMTITNSGRVGIGTTNPSKLLTIGDGTNNAAHALIRGGWGNADINKHGILYLNDTNWGIGAGSIKNNDNLYLFRFGQRPFRIMRGLPSDSDIDTKTDLFISTDGKVGIGTITPSAPLHVSGSVIMSVTGHNQVWGGSASVKGFYDHPPTANVSANFDRAIRAEALYVGCDKRLKDHVGELPAETALAAIKGLRPVFFRRRPDWATPAPANALLEAGFYAQELSENIPTATLRLADQTSPDGTKWEVGHDQLHAYAAGAIQALAKQIEELKAEVARLKDKLL